MHPSQSIHRRASRGYTLIEALVAGVVLMVGISAASKLTLTLLTQDEMNQRASTALNYLETCARLYQTGLDEADIRQIVPGDPVVDSMTFTPVAGFSPNTNTVILPPSTKLTQLFDIEAMDVSISFHPAPATESWTGFIWTSGDKNAVRSSSVTAGRVSTKGKVVN